MGRTVLIVDDHEGFRGVARLLLQVEGYDVVGEAQDGRSAMEAASALRPEVVLLDVHLPDVDGFSVARTLTQDHPSPAVVLVSARDADPGRLRSCGALGFLPKEELSGARLAMLLG